MYERRTTFYGYALGLLLVLGCIIYSFISVATKEEDGFIALFVIALLSASTALVAFLIALIVSKIRRITYVSDLKRGEIIKSLYEPPMGLSPAEIGYLYDSKFGTKEAHATLLDLEQRGYVSIKKRGVGLGVSFTGKNIADLSSTDKFVVENFTSSKNTTVDWHFNVSEFKRVVRSSLAQKGLLDVSKVNRNYLVRRMVTSMILTPIIATVAFSALFILTFDPSKPDPNLVPIEVVKGIFVVSSLTMWAPGILYGYIYHKIVGDTREWTNKMKRSRTEIHGYTEFVRMVELDELQFESQDLKIQTKNQTMPYAVAMNLNTKWKERFQ